MKKSIRDQIPDRGGFYYSNELYLSKAYQSLTPAARNLLHSLLGELKYRYIKGARKNREKITKIMVRFRLRLFIFANFMVVALKHTCLREIN